MDEDVKPEASAPAEDAIHGVIFPDVDFISRVARSAEIEEPDTAVAQFIGLGVKRFLRQLIKDTARFAAHGRRLRLISNDLDAALVWNKQQPMYGVWSEIGEPFRFAGSMGIETVLEEDGQLELTPIINAAPPKMPLEPVLRAHWLVIDGEQPAVPENPVPEHRPPPPMDPPIDAAQDGPTALMSLLGTPGGRPKNVRRSDPAQGNTKTITTHTIGVEQQVFFKEINDAIIGTDPVKRMEALQCVQTDAGVQSMLPRFSVAIVEGVRFNVIAHNLPTLKHLMRLVHALANNPAINLQRCLHELIPSVLTCTLSRQLCENPETENHWSLREFSAKLIAHICRSYEAGQLRTRVTRVLSKVWLEAIPTASVPTLYGSLFALNELGPETIRAVIVPRAAKIHEGMATILESGTPEARKEAERLNALVVKVLVGYVRALLPVNLKEKSDYMSTFGGYAEAVYREAGDLPRQNGHVAPVRQTIRNAPMGSRVIPIPSNSPLPYRRPPSTPSPIVRVPQRITPGGYSPAPQRTIIRPPPTGYAQPPSRQPPQF